jgi:hypothetical protein
MSNIYQNINEYMKRSKEERQSHLDLTSECIELGGVSKDFRGLMAHTLKTTIPYKMRGKICLCHACHNDKCSNPKHLYWGTYGENIADAKSCGAMKLSYPNPNRYIPTKEQCRKGGLKAKQNKVGIFNPTFTNPALIVQR